MKRILLILFIGLYQTSFSQDKSIIFNSEINIESFTKPDAKGSVKLVDNVNDLVELLHNEAKVI